MSEVDPHTSMEAENRKEKNNMLLQPNSTSHQLYFPFMSTVLHPQRPKFKRQQIDQFLKPIISWENLPIWCHGKNEQRKKSEMTFVYCWLNVIRERLSMYCFPLPINVMWKCKSTLTFSGAGLGGSADLLSTACMWSKSSGLSEHNSLTSTCITHTNTHQAKRTKYSNIRTLSTHFNTLNMIWSIL